MPPAARYLILILYLAVINLAGFYLMGLDKKRARKREWRVKESVFFGVSLLGGGIGCLSGMYFFRHKTKHTSFVIGIPVCMILGLALYGLLFYFLISV